MRLKPVGDRRKAGPLAPIPDGYKPPVSKEEFLERLGAGERLFCNANLANSVFEAVNFDSADLQKTDLSGSTFRNCQFDQAIFFGANLQNCVFDNLRATHCIFIGADLYGSHINNSEILYCDFTDACLIETVFESSYPIANTFTNSWFQFTSFLRSPFTLNDLSQTHHPDSGYCTIDVVSLDLSARLLRANFDVQHDSVDSESLYRQREVAEDLENVEKFFVRCGLPGNIFKLYWNLVSSAQHESVFISYSTHDEEFARELQSELSKQGIETWFAPHDMQGGKTILDQIQRGIRAKDRVILILSESSMSSAWVGTEIRESLESDRGIAKLFPVRLVDYSKIRSWRLFDADAGTDLAVKIREFFIPDFSDWADRDKFAIQVTGLVRALRKASDDAASAA